MLFTNAMVLGRFLCCPEKSGATQHNWMKFAYIWALGPTCFASHVPGLCVHVRSCIIYRISKGKTKGVPRGGLP